MLERFFRPPHGSTAEAASYPRDAKNSQREEAQTMIRLTESISVKLTAEQLKYLKDRAVKDSKVTNWYEKPVNVSDVIRRLIILAMKIDAEKAAAKPIAK
jgi:hypothetical protein